MRPVSKSQNKSKSGYLATLTEVTFFLYSKIISKKSITWRDWCFGVRLGRRGREVQADYKKPSSGGRKRTL